jgi:hypothetical protein
MLAVKIRDTFVVTDLSSFLELATLKPKSEDIANKKEDRSNKNGCV